MPSIPFPAQKPEYDVNGESSRRLVTFGIVNERGDMVPFDIVPLLILNINPQNMSESHTQNINRQATRGGWLEQHWGEELVDIKCDMSTGLFIATFGKQPASSWYGAAAPEAPGLTVVQRRNTMAHDRMLDFIDIYRNNGTLYDSRGKVFSVGNVRMIYDGGIFDGFFNDLSVTESSESPFVMELSWTFKVERTVMRTFGVPADYRKRIATPVQVVDDVTDDITAVRFLGNKNTGFDLAVTQPKPNEEGLTEKQKKDREAALADLAKTMEDTLPAEQAVDQQQVERGAGALAIGNTVALTQEALNSMLGIEEEG